MNSNSLARLALELLDMYEREASQIEREIEELQPKQANTEKIEGLYDKDRNLNWLLIAADAYLSADRKDDTFLHQRIEHYFIGWNERRSFYQECIDRNV